MSVIYVREQGAVVRKSGELLRVTKEGDELFTLPLANLEQLILVGNVQVTTPAAVVLMNSQVDVVFMSFYGRYLGRLLKLGSRFAQLRHQQLRLCDDDAWSLDVSKQIVAGKVHNQRVLLQRRAGDDARIRRSIDGMRQMLKQAGQATNLDQLRGYEGKAGAYYFEAVRLFFEPEWGFHQRAYYPPPDPANALLSFMYTLLLKDVETKIQIVGLDPYLGFFHALGYNRPALALDLMEEFRPVIADSVVLGLVSSGQITLADFERTNLPDLPVRMTRNAMETVITAYETRLADRVTHPLAGRETDYRRAIELQVRQMARMIRREAQIYEPLTIR